MPEIAAARLAMTDRAGRWATEQVGRHGRTVEDVAADLGADWHTVNDAVVAYGTALVDDANRFGAVCALGQVRCCSPGAGSGETQAWSTSIVDVQAGQLLDVIEGRTAAGACAWLAEQPEQWRGRGSCGRCWTCRGRGGWRSTRCCPTPHRSPIRSGSSSWPTSASTRFAAGCRTTRSATADAKTTRCIAAGGYSPRPTSDSPTVAGRSCWASSQRANPHGEVRMAWHAKEVLRSVYAIDDPTLAEQFVARLSVDLQDPDCPPETRQLGRTIAPLGGPDRRMAPRTRLERADRSREQSDQTGQTHRVRIPPLHQLPNPVTPLRRQTRLDHSLATITPR